MRLIIFNPYSAEIINPRSIRVQNLCKEISPYFNYLHICNPVDTFLKDDGHHRIFYGFKLKINNSNQLLKKNFIHRILNIIIWPDIFLLNTFYQAIVYFIRHKERGDVILTVSNPISIHLPFYFLKKLGLLKQKWLVDIGDTFSIQSKIPMIQKVNRIVEKSICNSADAIIVNAESMKKYYQDKYEIQSSKIEVIPNGSDLDFTMLKSKPSSIIRLSYFGNTYTPIREALTEMDLLTKVAKNLLANNMDIVINFFGHQYFELIQLYKKYSFIHFNNQLHHTHKLNAYKATDILLSFANKPYVGMPSKLEEYRETGLPIIHFCYEQQDPGSLYLHDYPKLLIYSLVEDFLPKLEEFIYDCKSKKKNDKVFNLPRKNHSWKILLDKLNNSNRLK